MVTKPLEQIHKYYNLEEIISYLERKHNITSELWDWLLYTIEPREDCGFWYLNIHSWLTYHDIPNNIRDALALMREEFCPKEDMDCLSVYVNWQ